MRKILIILITCLLTVTYCYSQSTLTQNYPRQINIGQDTVIAITVDQMKKINLDILELNKLKAENSILYRTISSKDSTIRNLQLVYSNTLKQDSLNQIQISYFKDIVSLQNNKYEEMRLSFYEQNKLLKKDLRKSNIKSGLIQSGVIISLILIPIVLIR